MRVLGLISVLVVASCVASPSSPYNDENNVNYSFAWNVLDDYSGNDFGHSENRQGLDTAGEYHVLLPDGRVQTVRYTVDKYSGFRARVAYDGEKGKYRSPYSNKIYDLSNDHVNEVEVVPVQGSQINYVPAPSYNTAYTFVPAPPRYDAPSPARNVVHSLPSKPAYPVQPTYPQYSHPKAVYPAYASQYSPAPSHQFDGASPLFYQQASNSIGLNEHEHAKASKKKQKSSKPEEDPYLRTEAELRGKSFDKPFYYPYSRAISSFKGRAKKDRKHTV